MPKKNQQRRQLGSRSHQPAHVQALEGRLLMAAHAAHTPLMYNTLDLTGSGGSSPTMMPSAVPPPGGVITPVAMRAYYGIDTVQFNNIPGDGRNLTIAIVDAYDQPNLQSDFDAFNAAYHLPTLTIQKYNQSGQTSPLASPAPLGSGGGRWGVETSLDVEWAHVIAPLANIIVVEANTTNGADLFTAAASAANKTGVAVVSMSFGSNEWSGETTWDSNFAHSGVTFVAATGDKGSPGEYPSYSPNVVAVGGTTVSIDPTTGGISGEQAWSGSGGGTSAFESQPTYQNGFQSTGLRTTPDVAMVGGTNVAVYDSYDNGATTPWTGATGTSLAAPMFAGVIAVADQGRVLNGLTKLNNTSAIQTHTLLYGLNSSDFHDITGGPSNGGFSPGVGYDQVTGRGTPVGSLMPNHLSGIAPSTPVINDATSGDTLTLKEDANGLYIDWSTGSATGQFTNTNPAGLAINGAGNSTIVFTNTNGNPVPNKLSLNGTFTINGLQGANPLAGSKWNINSSTLFITYAAGSDPLATVQQYLQTGYNGGAWNGSASSGAGSIVSSNAANDAAHLHGIGYVDSADGRGLNATPNSIELRYTLYGDTGLSGTVGFNDFMRMTQHFNSLTGGTWDSGDFNYDGAVNSADFALLQSTYGLTLATTPAPVPAVTTATADVVPTISTATNPTTTVVTPTAPTTITTTSNSRKNRHRAPSMNIAVRA